MARRITVTVADDTYDMFARAAEIEGISMARYIVEGGIMRTGYSFSLGVMRDILAMLERRIRRIEERLRLPPLENES